MREAMFVSGFQQTRSKCTMHLQAGIHDDAGQLFQVGTVFFVHSFVAFASLWSNRFSINPSVAAAVPLGRLAHPFRGMPDRA